MRLKLDENLSRHLRPPLEARGHDVRTAADEGLLRRPDTEVWAAARAEKRMLFTLDIEFADLRKYAPGDHPGIVLFRLPALGPGSTGRFVLAFAERTDLARLEGCVSIVEPDRVRTRKPE